MEDQEGKKNQDGTKRTWVFLSSNENSWCPFLGYVKRLSVLKRKNLLPKSILTKFSFEKVSIVNYFRKFHQYIFAINKIFCLSTLKRFTYPKKGHQEFSFELRKTHVRFVSSWFFSPKACEESKQIRFKLFVMLTVCPLQTICQIFVVFSYLRASHDHSIMVVEVKF